jgi:DNA sulfur modification protein DndB
MANRTLIPAFEAKVGDWKYYICSMKYAEVGRQVGFAYEMGGNKDLKSLIQRGLSARTEDIKRYLLNSEHRFLGGLIVACWGGEPNYQKVAMLDSDGMLGELDQDFGVLSFDGTQQYFVLDGQHRLKAIKDALLEDQELGKEEVCVLLVSHFETPEGRERTRRLFTNINRNAKTTTAAENIALDEDDGYSILTRRFLTDDPFLNQDGVVRVFSRQGDSGDIRLAGMSIAKTDPKAFTTITVLRDLLEQLGMEVGFSDLTLRPSPDVLEESYNLLSWRLDDLLLHCGKVRQRVESATSARDVRAPKGAEETGHAFMRPLIQRVLVRVIRQIVDQGSLTWDEVMKELDQLQWQLGEAPWLAVFNPANNSMVTAKENASLLSQLLYVHLAPPSGQAIVRARKQYKDLVRSDYPISKAELETKVKDDSGQEDAPDVTESMGPLATT